MNLPVVPGHFKAAIRTLCTALALLSWPLAAHAGFPGGFMESAETTTARGIPTPQQIQTFMSNRGVFTFPAPWNTRGIRITNASDCGGNDCVDYIGYSYWRNMSNSAGSNIMYIFVGLDRSRGGAGPTLFKLDKDTDQLTEVGPLFPPSSPYSWDTGEGWYFSYSMPNQIYIVNGTKLLRYDVLSHQFQTVFDISSAYPNDVIFQASSSNDDLVHAATLENGNYTPLGCVVYNAGTGQFKFFAKTGAFDECQIDKSGRFLVIKEKTQYTCQTCDEDNVIEDLQTGAETILLDQDGAGGHSDLGYDRMVAADNWNSEPNAWRVWDLTQNPLSGGLVTHDLDWNVFEPAHVSFENARPGIAVARQFACGSAANRVVAPHSNEITCFMLDGSVPPQSEQVLVVAPVMTNLDASGGGNSDYAKEPKGNIDPTGHYFIWTSNLGGNRLDAFIVKVPSQLLPYPEPDVTPPEASITGPAQGAVLSGNVTITADAADNEGVAGVRFAVDGTAVGPEETGPPYSISWDTAAFPDGTHLLTATATDAAGNQTTSSSISVSVENVGGGGTGGGSGTGGAAANGGGGGFPVFDLLALALASAAGLFGNARRRKAVGRTDR